MLKQSVSTVALTVLFSLGIGSGQIPEVNPFAAEEETAASLRLMFGLKKLTPRRWDGKVSVAPGRVLRGGSALRVNGMRFNRSRGRPPSTPMYPWPAIHKTACGSPGTTAKRTGAKTGPASASSPAEERDSTVFARRRSPFSTAGKSSSRPPDGSLAWSSPIWVNYQR